MPRRKHSKSALEIKIEAENKMCYARIKKLGDESTKRLGEICKLQAEVERLKEERDFAKKISDMYVKELSLMVKRIKQNLKGFGKALKEE